MLTRRAGTLVDVNFTFFAQPSWEAVAVELSFTIDAGGAISTRNTGAVIIICGTIEAHEPRMTVASVAVERKMQSSFSARL